MSSWTTKTGSDTIQASHINDLQTLKLDADMVTPTPTASKVPQADANGKLAAGWGGNASTIATLDGSSKVVQDPANATATPTASKIPIADANGQLDLWLNSFIDGAETQRTLMCRLAPGTAGFLLISGTAYFVYLGRTKRAFTPKYVEFYVSTAGVGAQTAEVGFFTSSTPPNKGAISMVYKIATGTVDSLTTTGLKRNTSAFSTSIPAGTHLWAGIRTAMATTQPTIWGVGQDWGEGIVQAAAGASALTGAGPWSGALISASTSVICPDLRGVLD